MRLGARRKAPEVPDGGEPRLGILDHYYSALLAIFLVVALVGFAPFTVGTDVLGSTGETGGGDALRQVSFTILVALAAGPCIARGGLRSLGLVPLPIWLLLLWCLVSLSWSATPAIGLRRLAFTSMVLITIFSITNRLSFDRAMTVILAVLASLVAISIVTVVIYPSGAIHQAGGMDPGLAGSWRGIFLQKNMAGSVAAICVLLCLGNYGAIKPWVRLCILAGSAVFLFFTRSETSILLACVCFVAAPVVYAVTSNRILRGVFLAALALGAALFAVVLLTTDMVNVPNLVAQIQPGAFTGRGEIWKAVIGAIEQRPVGGFGYGSVFGVGDNTPLSNFTEAEWVLLVAHAHNGYLDVGVNTGLVGLALVLVVVIGLPLNLLARLDEETGRRVGPGIAATWVFCLGHNFFEGGFLDRERATWVLLMLLVGAMRSIGKTDSAPAHAYSARVGRLAQSARREPA